jgi:hypothetical protein
MRTDHEKSHPSSFPDFENFANFAKSVHRAAHLRPGSHLLAWISTARNSANVALKSL